MYKRLIALIMTFIMMLSVVSVPTYSAEDNADWAEEMYGRYEFTVDVDVAALAEYLIAEMMSCPKRVSISDFNIPYTTEDSIAFQKLVWYGIPELFHVKGISFMHRNGYIDSILFGYQYEEDVYRQMFTECVNSATELLRGIKGNTALSDVTKILLIHDRLIENCEYDYKGVESGNISDESNEIYGALVNKTATCQGYSYAYMYLLKQIGIASYVCTSLQLNHDWNIVILDGKKYHVDVTFDDPVFDITGRVYHKYFLLSTEGMKANDHNAEDYDSSPQDTKYDNYYWRGCETGFQLIDNKVYYINNAKNTLNRVGDSKAICKIDDIWEAGADKFWVGNYARLSTDGGNLFYSVSDKIYLYDTITGARSIVYEPDMDGKKYFSIFGFKYDNGYLVCDLFNRPNFDIDTKEKYQIKVPYDLMEPTFDVTYTSEAGGFQKVTLDMYDDMRISGYYMGHDPDYRKNTFVPVNSNVADIFISESGRYYFTVKDGAGNVSDTASISFVCVELEPLGGVISIPRMILPVGMKLSLPLPRRSGHRFLGWTDDVYNTEYVQNITVFEDVIYYAMWEKDDNVIDDMGPDLDDYVNKFSDVSDSAWYADEIAYCVQMGYMNGVNATTFSPNASLTREQFVLILANASGIDASSYKYMPSTMKDVPLGQWYSGAVSWAVDAGYISGVSEGVFGLRQKITREQLARLFYIYAQKQGMDTTIKADLTKFSDHKSVGNWARENMEWAVGVGLITGMNGGMLAPRLSATRAQAARMFMMFDGLE